MESIWVNPIYIQLLDGFCITELTTDDWLQIFLAAKISLITRAAGPRSVLSGLEKSAETKELDLQIVWSHYYNNYNSWISNL